MLRTLCKRKHLKEPSDCNLELMFAAGDPDGDGSIDWDERVPENKDQGEGGMWGAEQSKYKPFGGSMRGKQTST